MTSKDKFEQKISKSQNAILENSFTRRLTSSRLIQGLCRGKRICQANPFPFQIFLIMVYRFSLDFLYLWLISPLFTYAGFTANLLPLNYACSVMTVFIFSPFVAKINEEKTASSIIVTLLNYLYFIPLTSYCGCKGVSVSFLLIFILYWAILLFLQCKVPVLVAKPAHTKHMGKIFPVLTIFSTLFVIFISWKYTGFRIIIDLFNVYDIRAEAAQYQLPTIATYLLSAMDIVLPILLLYCLKKRKYLIAVFLCFVLLLLFSIGGNKSIFFLFLASLACYFLFKPWMLRWISGLLSVFVGAAALEYKFVGTYYLMTLFFRRMMYIPAQLSEKYAIFFQENPLNLFRDGFMGRLSFDNIYSTNIPYIIGEFEGYPQSSANTGMLGDLFANLPVALGLFLIPLILILCFRLLDMTSQRTELKLLLPICLYSATTFVNASWSVALLSHGFLLACILMYFFPKEKERSI